MKGEIWDVEAVRALKPADVALYLRAKGWTKQETHFERGSLWRIRVGDEEFEALLPMDPKLRDYVQRMTELLTVLSVAENRSQEQVYSDLLTTSSDVMRIRIADPELSDGSLPIEEHAQIAQKARDLILAAACAATERRPVFHKRKPTQAMDYLRRVRIGQSERGSYIVTVISKVDPLLRAQDELFPAEDPYERRVTRTLAQSLHALRRSAEQAALTQEMASFDDAVQQGVNANLCDAVAGLWGGDEVRRDLEFSFSWSPARPVPAGSVQRVAFSSDQIQIIREAGRQMREREPLPDFELSGPVVKLERPDGAPTGRVTVIGLLDGRQVRVTMDLEGEEYHLAVQAHDQGQTVQTVGTLVKEGRGFRLKNPCDLVVETE